MTSDPPVNPADPRWLLSALADGEVDASSVERSCAAWAESDSAARRSWHAYHLIGDVLRSDDLASPGGHDQDFLERLRERLADEPAVLAPQPLPRVDEAPARQRRRWALPVAMAASVLALGTGVVLTLNAAGGLGPRDAQMAQAPAGPAVVVSQSAVLPVAAVEVAPQGSRIVRDAQLDRYLRAHREYGTALPGSLPGGAGRGITSVSFDR